MASLTAHAACSPWPDRLWFADSMPFADMHVQSVRPWHGLQVVIASYAEDEIQNRYYLTPFPVKAATDVPGDPGRDSL